MMRFSSARVRSEELGRKARAEMGIKGLSKLSP